MSGALVGREGELRDLGSALASGSCALVVHGEAGVGKTALVRAATHGRHRVEGGALASLSWLPHLPLRRAFDGVLADDVWRGDADYVADAVRTALGSRLLVLDDLQWADPETAAVVDLLVGRVPMLAAVRRGDRHGPSALDRLVRAGFTRLDVEPLPEDNAARLVQRLRPDWTRSEVDSAVSRSGGNPLLIEELTRVDESVDTLRLALRARVRPLSEDATEGLGVLAVAGRALAADVVPGLAELTESGLVVLSGGSASVRHALIGEVVEEMLAPERRRRCHLRVAEHLDHPGDLARHLLAAGETGRAYAEAMVAVESAETPGERAAHLITAASCVAGDSEADLLLRAARAANEAGEPDLATDLLARLPDTPAVRVRATLEEGRARFDRGDADGWQATVREGLALAAPDSPEQIAFRTEQAAVAYFLEGDPARAARLAQEVADDAIRLGLPSAFAHRMLGTAQYLLGDPRWQESLPEALRRARLEQDTSGLFAGANNLISAHESAGDPRVAVSLAEEMIGVAQEMQFTRWSRHFRSMRLNLVMHAGDHAEVIAMATQLLREPIMLRTREEAAAALAIARVDTGDVTGALSVCEEYLQDASIRTSNYHAIRAMALVADGRPAEALGEREPFLATEPVESLAAVMAPTFALAAFDADKPSPEYDATHPSWGMLAAVGPELGALAALRAGDPATAASGFEQAALLWAPYHRRGEVRCRWARGEALRRAGQGEAATEVLLAIEAEALDGGLLPMLGRIRRSLRAVGVDRRPGTSRTGASGASDVSVLTARERDVVRLAGEGLADRVIASRLGLSPRTVQSQLASARRKLGATNRRQAAELLAGGQQP